MLEILCASVVLGYFKLFDVGTVLELGEMLHFIGADGDNLERLESFRVHIKSREAASSNCGCSEDLKGLQSLGANAAEKRRTLDVGVRPTPTRQSMGLRVQKDEGHVPSIESDLDELGTVLTDQLFRAS